MLSILNNFYGFLAIVLFLVLVLEAKNYSLKMRLVILLIGTAVLLWLEKPDWLMRFISQIRSMFM